MSHHLRRLVRRFTFKSTKDSETESYATVEGLEDETFSNVMRVQQHGLSSHPPSGSHCIALALNGSADQMVIIGGESGSSRPTDLAEGDAKLYNQKGIYLHLEGNDLKISAPTSITLSVAGGGSIKLTAGRLDINDCAIFNDGVPIDKTHVHKDVVFGSALSGVPNS